MLLYFFSIPTFLHFKKFFHYWFLLFLYGIHNFISDSMLYLCLQCTLSYSLDITIVDSKCSFLVQRAASSIVTMLNCIHAYHVSNILNGVKPQSHGCHNCCYYCYHYWAHYHSKKKFLILFLDYGNTATIAKKCCIPLPSHYHWKEKKLIIFICGLLEHSYCCKKCCIPLIEKFQHSTEKVPTMIWCVIDALATQQPLIKD